MKVLTDFLPKRTKKVKALYYNKKPQISIIECPFYLISFVSTTFLRLGQKSVKKSRWFFVVFENNKENILRLTDLYKTTLKILLSFL